MDPAIIHYSKHNDSYLNDQEFGEYFIGLNNKENKNTLNGDKQNINNDNNYINNHSNNNIDINVNHNNNNHESSEILTPLNINTKLSFTERTVTFISYFFFVVFCTKYK